MAIFDRFRRKQPSVLPDEVQQYYQAEKRQKTGVAALLGVLALVITVAIASALFFGGRYAYRQINGSDNKTAQQEEINKNNTPETSSTKTPENNKKSQGGQTGQSNSPTQSTPGSAPTASTPQQSSPPPTTPTTTPRLGDEPAPLPHTGDPGM